MSRMKRFFLTVIGIVALSLVSFSQVDYEFWFAAPYANTDHAPYWPESYPYKVGGRPIYLRLATQDADADVTVSIPALGITVENLTIAANSTASVDLTPFINDIQCSKTGNQIENKGIYIRSNALITAYYEIASVLNTDIFSLKGQNALGKEFYAPFQNKMVNDTYHNGVGVPDNPVTGDGAYSYIVIVATQDNTTINVTPTRNCEGITAGVTKAVKLNRGQTYVVRATGQDVNSRLSGTYIKSTKPIAVTIGDDSAYPDYYTKSGDCEDYIGDQIVPTSVVGSEYIVVQGQGYKSAANSQENRGVDYYEIVAVTATQDNTIVTVDGAQYGSALMKGQTVSIELTDPNSVYTFVKATYPVYAFHISGYHCEVAGALLPSVEMCTGSYKMGFIRTYGTQNGQEFYMNLMVKGGGENDFLLNGVSNATINDATFEEIDGTDWKVARIYFSRDAMPEGAYFLQNTTSLFHMGMMNSTAHDWGDGKGYRLMGAMYGYFSRFSDNFPDAVIVNNNDTSITVTRGTKVSLLADGGHTFSWVGYQWDGHDWALMTPNYLLNNTNVENPYVIIDAIGVYKYTATITTACYGDVEQSVLIKVVEPFDLNTIKDTVCYTPGLSIDNNMSESYNLFNLNDTIVGKKGMVTGYYVDHFEKFVPADTVMWDDFDANRTMATNMSIVNGSLSLVDNPDTESSQSPSGKVAHLVKTSDGWRSFEETKIDPSITQQSTWIDVNFTEHPLDFSLGAKFTFDIRYDSVSTGGSANPHDIYMDVIDDAGTISTLMGTSLPTVCNSCGEIDMAWVSQAFDFSLAAESMSKIVKVRIRAISPNSWYNKKGNYGYYIDNFQYYTVPHMENMLNTAARDYTITDGDSLYAVVKNNFDLSRVDTSMVYLAVKNPGIDKRGVKLADTCATEGSILKEFNLTQYNYQMGGALVANRNWFWDSQKTRPIENPLYVEVPAGSNTFYVYVDDECVDIPGRLTLDVYAIPVVQDATVTVCEQPKLGGDQGLIDLTQMKSKVTTDAAATIEWYKDEACTQLVGSLYNIPVVEGSKFYAKIYNNTACPAYATLTVDITSVDDITFTGFGICADAEIVALNATPAGGIYKGDGVVLGNQFDPSSVVTGPHKITYTITNEGCENSETVEVMVNPEVFVNLTNKSGKIQKGATANLEAKITPASTYSYTWTDASKLASSNTLTPTTIALDSPTFYTIEVEDNNTGCSASAKVLVDVYVPVSVSMDLTPLCAGKDVLIEAVRTGGTGPFTYEWSLSPSVPFTENDSVITIANIQSTVDVTVTVTDQTEGDVRTITKTQTVYPNPSITLEGAEVCQHTALELKPVVTGGTAPYVHKWSNNTQILTTPTTAQNASINTSDNLNTYYLTYTVTDDHSCSDSENATVIINQQPKVSASIGKTISCVGDDVQLTGTVTLGSTAGNVKHEWISANAADLSSTSIPNPVLNSFVSGTLSFQYKFTDAEGCSATSNTVSVQNFPNPIVTINDVPDQCASNMGVQLVANPKVEGVPDATFTYDWTGDVTSTEDSPLLDISKAGDKNVKVQVTSNTNCVATATKTIKVNPNPIAEILAESYVCASDTLQLRANGASSNVTYKWDGGIEWLNNNASVVEAVLPANTYAIDTILYPVTLTVTDKTTSCTSVATKTIHSLKRPEVSLGDDLELCNGSEVELHPNISYVRTKDYKLVWKFDVEQLSSVNVLNPIYKQNGVVNHVIGVEVTDNSGCSGESKINISGLENPTANAGIDREEEWNEDFTITGSATGGTPGYTYLWSPKDSLTTAETLQNPTARLRASTKFYLQVTDAKECKGYDTVMFTIVGQPLSVLIEQRPNPLCYGNKVTLEAIPSGGNKGGQYAYEWYKESDLATVIGTQKTIQVAPEVNTAYKVVLNSIGPRYFEPTETTHTVVVNPLPIIGIKGGLNPFVCKKETISIISEVSGGAAPYSYTWSDGTPISVKTENYMFSNSASAGNKIITLVVTDNIGCSDSVKVNVEIGELPTVSLDPIEACVNVETTATAVVSNGHAPYYYVWSGIEGMTSSSNTATFTVPEDGMYDLNVAVSDDKGCKNRTNAPVTIKPESDLALEPSYDLCAGEDLDLIMNPNNLSGFFTMHWVGGDRNRIVDSTKINRLISTFRSSNEGTYTLYYTIADDYNCPRLDSTKIVVYPAVKLAEIPDTFACVGVGLNLEAEVLTGNPLTYTWLGTVSPTNQKATTYLQTTPGEYTVSVIAGDQHCSDTKEFKVDVQPNPTVEIIGAPIKLVDYTAQVGLTSRITTYTTSPFTHQWKEAANITSGAATEKIITKPITQTTEYSYQIIDKYGCKANASITLQTELIIPKITRLCDGTEVEVTLNELIDSNKVCLTDDGIEICVGDSVYLIPQFVSGNNLTSLTYSWYDDQNLFLGNDINILVKPTKLMTTYKLVVANAAGFSTNVTYSVIAHPIPTASITVSPDYNGVFYTMRKGKQDIISINGNPSPASGVYTSHWTTSPAVSIKDENAQITNLLNITEEIKPLLLTYSAKDQYGCETKTSREIEIIKQAVPIILGDNVCINTTATYSLSVKYPVGTQYVWSVTGGTIEKYSADNSSIDVYWNESENTKVTVSIYPPNGQEREVENVSQNIYVIPMPDVTINGKVHVCEGESAVYEVVNNKPSMELLYTWRVADNHGELTDISAPASTSATVLWNTEGKDTVIVQASTFGYCPIKEKLVVYVHPIPSADFTYAASEHVYFIQEDTLRPTDSIFVDKEVTFTNLTSHRDTYEYFWDFIGDGVYTENSRDAIYEYDETGDFNVSLMVLDNTWGCKNQVSKPLKVIPNPNCGLTFPNAFTPDLTDNNTFYPVFKAGVLETGYELRVYNRWGTLMWTTNDLYGEWDGIYKGSISKQDVYVYHCKATCEDIDPATGTNRVLNIKGDVTVIR